MITEFYSKKRFKINVNLTDTFFDDSFGNINFVKINKKTFHRKIGPSKIFDDDIYCGTKEWWNNGKVHRNDGPAEIFYSFKDCVPQIGWWFKGKKFVDEESYWNK